MRTIVRFWYLVMTRVCPDLCDWLVRSRFGFMLHRRLWRYSVPKKVRHWGLTFWLPKNAGAVPTGGRYLEDPELNWVLARLKCGDVCVDMGANVGYWTCLLAARGMRVHSFEPCAANFRVLRRNVDENGLERMVTLYNAACGAVGGTGILHYAPMASGHTLTDVENGGDETVNIVAVGSVVDQAVFAKVDVEGWEAQALSGMSDLIEKCSPALMVELSPKFHNVDETIAALRGYGYTLYNITHKPQGRVFDKSQFKADRRINVWCVKE